jgi:hypothetical protein
MIERTYGSIWKALFWFVLGVFFGLLIGWYLWAKPTIVQAKVDKVNICHSTDGVKYEALSVDDDGHWKGHDAHEFDYLYKGTTDDKGKPNDKEWCAKNVPAKPVDLCINIEGNQEVLPENMEADEKAYCDCITGYHRVKMATLAVNGYEYFTCSKDKSVVVLGACDGTFKVTIYGGETRRTWRVEGIEKWIDYNESAEFDATTLDTVIEWKHQSHWDVADESYVTRTPAMECGGGSEPTNGGSTSILINNTTDAPQCTATKPVLEALNFHILRNGDTAIAKWMPTNGNKANIYYKLVTSNSWEHAVRDIENNGYFVINGLGSKDWTFALQQANDCAGGLMSQYVVDGNSSIWVLFR